MLGDHRIKKDFLAVYKKQLIEFVNAVNFENV